LDNPQSLNLYSYVWNSPLLRNDPDGHCGKPNKPKCDDIKITTSQKKNTKAVIIPFIHIGGKDMGGTGAYLENKVTTDKGKPLSDVKVHEDNNVTTTVDGRKISPQLQQRDTSIQSDGTFTDFKGLLEPATGTQQDNDRIVQEYSHAIGETSQQTLTLTLPSGNTCSATATSTLTNGNGGPNYTITFTQPTQPVVTPAPPPIPSQ
jgi:hypothetical protein